MGKRGNMCVAAVTGIAFLITVGCEAPQPKRRTARKPAPETAEVIMPEGAVTSSSRASTPSPNGSDTPSRSARIVQYSGAEKAALRERALELLVNTALAGSNEERANAMEALTSTPARLGPVAESALQDENVAVRTVAAMAIGKAKARQYVGKVAPLLKDASPFARSAAIFALRRSGVGADPSSLAPMLFDSSPRLRAHAAYILGELGDKSALGPLREAHKIGTGQANQSEVRISDLQIAEARVKLGDSAALSDIRASLFPARAEDLEATVLAIQIIGQVKDNASINRLIDLTAAKDPTGQDLPGEVRMAAAIALARMGQPEGSYIAREFFAGGQEAMRAQAAHLFGATRRPENLQILSRMLEDPDGRVRVAAAAAIIKIADRVEE